MKLILFPESLGNHLCEGKESEEGKETEAMTNQKPPLQPVGNEIY